MSGSYKILVGDCRKGMRSLPEKSVHTCITSPPYFGLRDYGHQGQIGLEPTPDEFVAAMVEVFREVKRVLRDDGTVWLNLGDSYSGSGKGPSGNLGKKHDERNMSQSESVIAKPFRAVVEKRNRRSVWTVTTKPFKGAHFATYPPDLIKPCVIAGCPIGGTVLDPFFGAGTTGLVAVANDRNAVGCEINMEYALLAFERIGNVCSEFSVI
jgi:DNA modification methylase